jgi:NAD(P)H dehydrogenase (quinone)
VILVTGATGRVGHKVAAILAGTGTRLRLMTRDPAKAEKFPRSEIVQGDFENVASLDAAFEGVRTALVISGSGAPGKRAELHRNAFEAALRARTDHVVYLSLMGASLDSKYPYSRDHYVSEQYLADTGLPHTVLRDAFYFGTVADTFDSDGVIRGPAGEGRGAFVSRQCVARTAAAILLQTFAGSRSPGGCYEVTGPEALTLGEVAQRLSPIAGHPLRYEPESAESMRKRLRGAGVEESKIELQVGWFEAIGAGELARPTDTVRRFTGTMPRKLESGFTTAPNLMEKLRHH